MTARDRREREAAKKRRYREAVDEGRATPRTPLKDWHGAAEVLVKMGWLTWSESEDKAEIGRAIGMMMNDLVSWYRAKCPQWTDGRLRPWQNLDRD